MSKTKHTPGPWEISDDFTDHHHIVIDLGHGVDGCVLIERHVEGHDAADFPNAHLIITAPEMLEALKSVVHFVKNGEGVGNMLLLHCEAVIARATKAEGKE